MKQTELDFTTDATEANVLACTGDIGELQTTAIRTRQMRLAKKDRPYLREAGQHAFIVDVDHLIDGSGAVYRLNDGGSATIRKQFAACIKAGIPTVKVVVGRVYGLRALLG